MVRTLAVCAALFALSACASSAAPDATAANSGRDCFRVNDVNNYGVVDDRRISARVGTSRRYYLTLSPNARDLDWSTRVELRSRTSFVCVGDGIGAGVEVIGGNPVETYRVTNIERAPEETAATPGS